MIRSRTAERLLALIFCLALALVARPAHAESIIKRPGDHPNYGFELEPHLLAQYDDTPYTTAGFGLGLRVAIPFVHNGPVTTINNNIGISFGMDWVHFGDDNACNGRGSDNIVFFPNSCSGTHLRVPVTGQWSFFLTPIISVFGELGLAMRYTRWDYDGVCNGVGCSTHYSHVDPFVPVLWAGGRFMFSRAVGLTVRLGWPYISVGAALWF